MGHTKGPWSINESEIDLVQIKSKDKGVAITDNANAHLIAAAPELLENFEKAIKLIEHIQEKYGLVHQVTINDGHKLIQKAKGK